MLLINYTPWSNELLFGFVKHAVHAMDVSYTIDSKLHTPAYVESMEDKKWAVGDEEDDKGWN